jgi:hypothetical protein
MDFIEYHNEIAFKFEKNLGHESGDQVSSLEEN